MVSALCITTKRDRPLADVLEGRVLGRERHAQFQRVALHLSITDHVLDLALRCDANLLQEFGQFDVEAVLVPGIPPRGVWPSSTPPVAHQHI